MVETDIAIIGAGPYGLSVAAHLRHTGRDVRVFGRPMSFWRSMPLGMLLRSNLTATCIAEYDGPLSLEAFCAAKGLATEKPVTLARFIDYGDWVQQQAVPDLDERLVERVDRARDGFMLTLRDGAHVDARRVVIAGGIAPFAWRPPEFDDLPPELASHTGDHHDLSRFAGQRVLVVGGGQSALESAALMHETGAEPEVVARTPHINWLHGGVYHRKLGRYATLVYAPTDVGPLGLSRLVGATDLYRRLPRLIQEPLTRRSIRPAGARWLVQRLDGVPIREGETVRTARANGDQVEVQLSGGGSRTVDHLLFGTGYRVDVARYPFLPPELVSAIRLRSGFPVLRRGLESSIPRLHFVGAPAAFSFGPTMRFVSGSWYAGRQMAKAVSEEASDQGARVFVMDTRRDSGQPDPRTASGGDPR